MKVLPGNPNLLGVCAVDKNTVNLSIVPSTCEITGVKIKDSSTNKWINCDLSVASGLGGVRAVKISGINPLDFKYKFYSGDKEVGDVFAKRVFGNEVYGKIPKSLTFGVEDDTDYMALDVCPRLSYDRSVFYALHVRGFTMDSSSGVENPGTFDGIREKIPYLKELGITTLMLMPCYEFIERENFIASFKEKEPKLNYWGYKPGFYFAPKASYCAKGKSPRQDLSDLIIALHREKMELVLEFYFDSLDCFTISEILKYYVLTYHVDGFHLMGENIDIQALATNPYLKNTKLLYYDFDEGAIYKGVVPKEITLASFNDDFMYNIRRFIKSDEGQVQSVIAAFKPYNRYKGNVHYISNTNTFTLMDTVSYDRKHNEENGENNLDGNPYNASWNCGIEGTTPKAAVNKTRLNQIRNAIILNTLTRSTPMIVSGDEMGNSQGGNNNPYCIDGKTTYINWLDLEKNKEIYAFYKEALALRRKHAIISAPVAILMNDYLQKGFPDCSLHGEECWSFMPDILTRDFGLMYNCSYGDESDESFLYLAVNTHWGEKSLGLPSLGDNRCWRVIADSTKGFILPKEYSRRRITLKERSILVLINEKNRRDL